MHMHTEVLSGIATRSLPELERIAAAYAHEARQLPGYSIAAVTDEELHRAASASLGMLLRLLSGQPLREQLAATSEAIGRRRARQGVALDSLLRAVRMDFTVLWGVLRAEATAAELVSLADGVPTIWEAVELHTSRLQSAYIDELALMNRELERERATLLRRLLLDGAVDQTQLEHVAAAFGLPVEGRFFVAVASSHHLALFREQAAALRPRVDLHVVDGVDFVIVDALHPGREGEQIARLPAGISPVVDGIGQLAAAWQVARRLAEHVDEPGEPATVATHWPYLALEGLGEVRRTLLSGHVRALDALPPERAQPLLTAVREYMASGSINQSAGRLFLHRNTMLKRMQRFTELTGLDPSTPNDAATIRLLLASMEEATAARPRG